MRTPRIRNSAILVILTLLLLHSASANAIYSFTEGAEGKALPEKLVYKRIDTVQLTLEFVYPEHMPEGETYPAIVFFFGGGWKKGTTDQFRPHADYLAQRGMIGILADYRVESRHGTTPYDAVKDAKSALRFVREHAGELQIDPDRIVASGGSAGGHLAAATACISGLNDVSDDLSISAKPNAMVLFNPVFDNGPEGYGYDRIGERYPEISPLHNLGPGMPPASVFLGTQDRLIPVSTAEAFRDGMEAAGNRCDLFLYEGKGHGFFNYRHPENYRETILDMSRFLESLGYIEKLAMYDMSKILLAKDMAAGGSEYYATAVDELKLKAEAFLSEEPVSVMDKIMMPPSGNKHDYYSLGIYWWPDPDKEDGLPYIRHDGKRNPEYGDYDGPAIKKISNAVFQLTLAWIYTGKQKYAESASDWIRTWFLAPETRMNPHLEFGQAIPGITEGRGIGIIETDEFIPVVEAVAMLKGSGALTKVEHEQIRQWFREYNHWLLTSDKGWDERRWHNNHGSCYDSQVAAYALFTGDDATARMILDSVKLKRLDLHFESDGSQPFELERTKAMGYSIYNLFHLFRNALLAENYGMDLWNYRNPRGGGIVPGILFLIPYLEGEKDFPYEQMGGIESQVPRFIELLEMAGERFDDSEIRQFMERHKDKQGKDVLVKLSFPDI